MPPEMTMGVFLCVSRHGFHHTDVKCQGIHVSSCVIVLEHGFRCCLPCVGVRFTLERLALTRHRIQLFHDPIVYIAVPYRMAPKYECTPTPVVHLEFLPYGA